MSYSTDQDFLRSLFQAQSPGKPIRNGEKSSPVTPGFSSPMTGTMPDSDALNESEALSILALFGMLAFLSALAEESETFPTPGDSAEEKPSKGSTGKSFNKGDVVRVTMDVEAVVPYNSDADAEGLYLKIGDDEGLTHLRKEFIVTELITPADQVYFEGGMAYMDSCHETFIRRMDYDEPADDRRWVNEFGEFTDEVCPPLKRLKA